MTTIMIKATNACNLACDYCSHANLMAYSQSDYMTPETATAIMKGASNYENASGRLARFQWTGGEFGLMKADFYRHVVQTTHDLVTEGAKIENCVQSNGTHFTKDEIEYLVQNDVRISFSLDGVGHVHDQTRKYKGGQGSFGKAIETIRYYRELTGNASVILVLNRLNLPHLLDFYEFCNSERISFQVNALQQMGLAAETDFSYGLSPKEYQDAMINLFETTISKKEETVVESGISIAMGNAILQKDVLGNCLYRTDSCQDWKTDNLIAFTPKGDAYPCTHLDGDIKFYLGNINEDKYQTIAESPIRKDFVNRKGIEKRSNSLGCPAAAFHKHRTIHAPDPYQSARTNLGTHVKIRVEEILATAKIENQKRKK